MLMDIGFAQQLLKKQGQISYIAVFHVGNDTSIISNQDSQAKWQTIIGEQGNGSSIIKALT